MKGIRALIVGACCALTATAAQAAVTTGGVTVGTAFQKIAPPPAVGNNEFNDNGILYAFDELQNVTLTDPLTADVGLTTIPAGTVISSHYVFFDPAGTILSDIDGLVNFDQEVIAILTGRDTLEDSDFLGTATSYTSVTNRGLESGDLATITGTNQIRFEASAGSPGDFIRVITLVPEPASISLLALGSLAMLRRRLA